MLTSKKKVAILSNITVDLLAKKLSAKYELYYSEGYDTWIQEVINPSSSFYEKRFDSILVMLDGTEARGWKSISDGKERIALWRQTIIFLADRIRDIPIVISTIDFRENRIKSFSERRTKYEYESGWYQFVYGLVETRENVFILDLVEVIADIGRNHFYSNKMWYMGSMPFSLEGLTAVSKWIDRVLRAVFEERKKAIVLDLDNTLWGGVIGEDGVDGIELSDHKQGQRYYDFQRQLLEMKNRGIVLAINSKNNPEEVEETLKNHPSMLLRMKDFANIKINWQDKASNMKDIERELNLTEAGFIVVDDNPIERETIRGECPEAIVPEFPKDTTELLLFAEDIWFDYCIPLRTLDEDKKRTEMYQVEARRKQDRKDCLGLEEYIAKLEMSVDIHRMRPNELERVTQLVNKTNQFNVTTRRYSKTELKEIASRSANQIYVVYSRDKYGDYGLISVIILIPSKDYINIDTFLMSCRVMGRKIEEVIMNALIIKNDKPIKALYIQTSKNSPVRDLFDKLGFERIKETDNEREYLLNPANYQKKTFDYYKEIIIEG